jgi:phage terminase large subunit-like protein
MKSCRTSSFDFERLPLYVTAFSDLIKDRSSTNRLDAYQPYEKQAEFHVAGSQHRERLFLAGNQLGKTLAGGFEEAIHATGKYPEWWAGRRFPGPTVSWVAGVTGESTRDTVQRILLGRPEQRGTGALPGSAILSTSKARGVTDLVDTIRVRHVSGGVSTIALKSYEKGREKWQGETLHRVWFDEEPPQDIYTEGLTRTNATGGIVWLTLTPLLGMSSLVQSFLESPTGDRHVTQMTIDDAEHYTAAERARIIAGYPAHEREARAKGIPILGSGRTFQSRRRRSPSTPSRFRGIGRRSGASISAGIIRRRPCGLLSIAMPIAST